MSQRMKKQGRDPLVVLLDNIVFVEPGAIVSKHEHHWEAVRML